VKHVLWALLLLACTRTDKPAPPDATRPADAGVVDAAPADAAVAVVPRPAGASFPCGPETCHAQQYCRRVAAGKGVKKWSTIACAAVPDPCKDTPDCACLARYGVEDRCVDEAGHAVVDVSY
jgi:hypothetical protein